jgi:glycosyltransferase involved in cell wall biosynthesis
LEAFATGVPVVTQNAWWWKEMVEHGETEFFGNDDCELAHYAAVLAHDERLRLRIARNAYEKLISELANPEQIGNQWQTVFKNIT